jgi:hypothetical protein
LSQNQTQLLEIRASFAIVLVKSFQCNGMIYFCFSIFFLQKLWESPAKNLEDNRPVDPTFSVKTEYHATNGRRHDAVTPPAFAEIQANVEDVIIRLCYITHCLPSKVV